MHVRPLTRVFDRMVNERAPVGRLREGRVRERAMRARREWIVKCYLNLSFI